MSALSAIESPVVDDPAGVARDTAGSAHAGPRLRLLRLAVAPDRKSDELPGAAGPDPRSSSIRAVRIPGEPGEVLFPSAVIAPRPTRARTAVTSPPLRLTRRGQVVVALLVMALTAAIAVVVALAAAGGAQAANHGQPGAGYRGLHQIVVRPGQTLWSIASAAEPGADPRDVVQQIMTANAMTGTAISAGQLLWVPR